MEAPHPMASADYSIVAVSRASPLLTITKQSLENERKLTKPSCSSIISDELPTKRITDTNVRQYSKVLLVLAKLKPETRKPFQSHPLINIFPSSYYSSLFQKHIWAIAKTDRSKPH